MSESAPPGCSTLVDRWLTLLGHEAASRRTVAAYGRDRRPWAGWRETTFGQIGDLAAVIRRGVADYKAWPQITGVAPATVNRGLTAASAPVVRS